MQIHIVPIFKNGDRSIPSNYITIMISPILANLYGIILEKKISFWLETHRKRAKGHDGFRRYHSIMDHLFTFRIIAEKLGNTKTNIFFFSLTLENILISFLGKTFVIGWKK
jgi:hypothetical protein